jgi:hypothetical protein
LSGGDAVAPLPDGRGSDGPVRPIRTIVMDSGDPGYANRLLVGTACTGLVRIEWVAARYGQLVPINWSMAQLMQYMAGTFPLRFQVADAQNLIVKDAIEKDMEWLFLLEHDVVIPPDTFVRLNRYMREATAPVVSGLYFSRAQPSEPMVFRGRGNSFFDGWRMGDVVECDGVPTGCLLIHMGVLRLMWAESEEYTVSGVKTRRVFNTPRDGWLNPETGQYNFTATTSDLDWCDRVMRGDYLRRAGWLCDERRGRWPFLVDTNIFCWHINPDGRLFPSKAELAEWQSEQ